MGHPEAIGRRALVALLCLSLALWSLVPVIGHAPVVFDTIGEHLEMVADHGHAHGFVEDVFEAMHGHAHDVTDHDHSPAWLGRGPRDAPGAPGRDAPRIAAARDGPFGVFRIDRPPRA